MTHGKNICKQLKEVRKRIAEENEIPLKVEECTYKGECRGTCPRCEAEVRYLENALTNRLNLGKVATVAGLALGLASCGDGTSSPQGSNSMLTTDTTPANTDTIPTADTIRPVWSEPDIPDEIITGELIIYDNDTLTTEADFPEDARLEGETDIVCFAEEYPEFPGGEDAMYQFIKDNMQYPLLASENGIEGKVYVSIIIGIDGTVQNPRILRDIGGGCGDEAIRIVKLMPKWTPGKVDGKPARIQYTLPIIFEK